MPPPLPGSRPPLRRRPELPGGSSVGKDGGGIPGQGGGGVPEALPVAREGILVCGAGGIRRLRPGHPDAAHRGAHRSRKVDVKAKGNNVEVLKRVSLKNELLFEKFIYFLLSSRRRKRALLEKQEFVRTVVKDKKVNLIF